ncbi:hypothetical protein C7N43_38695, partial [Sphingobacteriales bacterium UPWRP_1]
VLFTPTSSAGSNSNNKYYNFSIKNSYAGVLLTGNATFPDVACEVGTTACSTYNTIGDPAVPNDIGNGTILTYGVKATNQSGVKIFNNAITNITNTSTTAIDGIFLDNATITATTSAGICQIYGNKISNLFGNNAASGRVVGIRANLNANATSASQVYNNWVSALNSTSTVTTSRRIVGIMAQESGAGAGAVHNIDFNNVSLAPAGIACPNACFEIGSASTGATINVRNNVFSNTTAAQAGAAKHYCWASTGASNKGGAGSVSNYNDLWVANANGFVGLIGTDQATLANWQAAAPASDANSISIDPIFVNTNTDLHVSAAGLNGGGNNTGITWVTNDIDCQTRPLPAATNFDIGADEIQACIAAAGGTITPGTQVNCAGQTATMTSVGAEVGAGITYQWEVSTTGGGAGFVPVSGGTGATSTTYTTAALAAGTYYYRLNVTCSAGPITGYSNELMVTVNTTPTASASNNGPLCPGSALNLSATTDVGIIFLWAGPNTFSSGLQNPSISSVTGSAAGTYTVTVTLGTCSATASTVVAINAPVAATATATPAIVCNPGSTQLNAVGGTTSAYTMSSSTFGLLTATGTVTNTATGDDLLLNTVALPFNVSFFGNTYSNILIYSNGYVAFQTGVAGFPYVQTIPDAAAPNNFIAISHDDLNVTAAGQLSYFTNGVAPNRIFVINYNGVKYFNVAANNGNLTGQVQIFEADQHIEIHVQNSVDPTLSAKSLGIENAGGTVGYAPATRNNLAYDITTPEAWSFFPSGGTLGYAWAESPATPATLSATNIANPTASGITGTKTYTVTITETTSGCSNTASAVVTASAPISAATITPASPAFCTGGSVTLTATPSDGGAPFTYAWSGPGGPAGTAATQVANVGGTWTVTVTDNCGGNVVVSTNVTQNPVPTATAGSNSPICAGSTLNLTLATDVGTTFAWTGPNTFTSSVQNPSISSATTAAAGTYNVTVSTGAGCSASSSTAVTVNTAPTITSVTATPAAICTGQNSQLQVNVAGPAAYCPTSYTIGTGSGDYLSSVSIVGTSLSNATGASASPFYTLFPASGSTTATLAANTLYTLEVIAGTYSINDVAVWIDYNQDGVFQEPGEKLGEVDNFGATPTVASINFTVPLTALNGTTRMRVREADQTSTNALPACGSLSFGEVEDYDITITGGLAANTYSWSPALFLNNADIANPLASAVTATTPYTVTVTGGNGCTSTGSVTVTVNPNVTAGTISGTSPLCLGGTATFSSTGGTAGGTWSSDNTGVATVDPSSGLVTAQGQGTANITYTVNTGCGSPVSASASVTVNALDYANLQFPASGAVTQGCIFTAYGQVYEPGLTDGPTPNSTIIAEFGVSPAGSNTNPNTWTSWVPATINPGFAEPHNNDEYWVNTNINLPPGTYYYTFRYAYPGCPGAWQYGGFPAGFWDGTNHISGVLTVNPQPAQPPVVNCWDNYVFNTTTCSWNNTGSQPAQPPVVNCWDNFVFNTTTCVWDNTGSQPAQPPVVNCWDNFVFNTTTCSWNNTGSQPAQPPVVNCWDNFVFNTTTCVWDNTGSQPAQPPVVNCWDNYVFNTTTCQWVNTGTQPAQPPVVNCWDNFVFNTTTCVWDNTGSQPAQPPVVNCWDNYVFNTTTCQWVNTGSQPAQPPVVNCWDNYVFNTTTCVWDNTGSQPAQ